MNRVFCYGSNDPDQLLERLGLGSINTKPAVLKGYKRVFRGFSQHWQCGTASVIKDSESVVYGFAVLLTKEQLKILDGFEGYFGKNRNNYYERIKVEIENYHDVPTESWIYVRSSRHKFYEPSEKYLKAVCKTINTHWRNSDGSKVKPKDIPIQ